MSFSNERELVMLDDDFRAKVITLLENCKNKGVTMKPYFGARSPKMQAGLWCRSRTPQERDKMVAFLRTKGANYLADCLDDVESCGHDRWATNAVPGRSWHNYGLAVDCFNLRGKTANWDADSAEYKIYAEEAKALGMESGYYWRSRDAVHVQAVKDDPLQEYSWSEIDKIMRVKWS